MIMWGKEALEKEKDESATGNEAFAPLRINTAHILRQN